MSGRLGLVAFVMVVLAGCNEGLSPVANDAAPGSGGNLPGSTVSPQEAAVVLGVVDGSGWFAQDFGAVGATTEFQNQGEAWAPPARAAAPAAPDAAVSVPEFWGRLRGDPVSRVRTVTETADTAWVSLRADYDGSFLVDLTPADARLDVTAKPLVESLLQQARLEKSAPGEKGERHWVLVSLTPQQYVATDPSRRTVKITQVTVSVNGVVKLDVTDPGALAKVSREVPLFNKGDTIKVVAKVTNTTGTGNTPPTFAFMSSYHADPNGLGWRRIRMDDKGDGSYSRTWVAQWKGRERIIVEALDAQAFATPTADDYRANVWAIPYEIQ